MVWFILWMVCASESPSQHGRINNTERQYIIDTLMTESVTTHQVSTDRSSSNFYIRVFFFLRPDYDANDYEYVLWCNTQTMSHVVDAV